MLQHLVAAVNSASTSCPLGNTPSAPLFNSGYAIESNSGNGAKARAVTASNRPRKPPAKSATRSACTMAGAPVTRTASRRKPAFFLLLSIRWISAALWSANAHAIGSPGKPAPEPRSTHLRAAGAIARSCSESAMWRVHSTGTVEAAIKFMRPCQSSNSAAKRSRRATVSRETGTSASARARSAVRSGCATCRFARCVAAGAAQMSCQQRQRGGRHAINAAGLSDGARAMPLKLLPHLVGEAGQGRVIEIFAEHEALVPAIRLHVGRLTAEIDVVLRIDLKLLGSLGVEFVKGRPD